VKHHPRLLMSLPACVFFVLLTVWFKLPGDCTRYERVSPFIRAAWNKMVAAAQEDPVTFSAWKMRKPRESCQPREAFVPVAKSGGCIVYKRITEL
jgi:hypothetical protein